MPESDDNGCTFSSSGDCFLEGTLNVQSANHYAAGLKVTNHLASRESRIPVQAEPNSINVTEVEVQVLNTGGAAVPFDKLPNPFRLAATGFAEPGGEAIVYAELLPPAYVAQLAAAERSPKPYGQVIAAVVLRGKTAGQVEVETAEWRWPIRLVSASANPDDLQCRQFADFPCTFGQDAWAAACVPEPEM